MARVGEPVEHDRRAARPGAAVQVPGGLVQVRRGVQEARREAAPSRGSARRSGGRPDPAAPPPRHAPTRNVADSTSSSRLRASSRRASIRSCECRAVGRLEEQHGVDEVDPPGAGVDVPPCPRGHLRHSLALDVGELAALGGQPFGRPDLAEAHRHERHRLGARERADPHRDRHETRRREESAEPTRRHLGRPTPRERQPRDEATAGGEPGTEPVRRADAGELGPAIGELGERRFAHRDPALLGDPGRRDEHAAKFGLGRPIEEQVRPAERPAGGRG